MFHLLADGILAGPILLGHGLIDDGDGRRSFAILRVEIASTDDWSAQRAKIAGADFAPLEKETWKLANISHQHRVIGHASMLDSRRAIHGFNKLIPIGHLSLVV